LIAKWLRWGFLLYYILKKVKRHEIGIIESCISNWQHCWRFAIIGTIEKMKEETIPNEF